MGREEHMRLANRVEAISFNISKCYEDVLEFKDHVGDLLTTFKIEFLVN